MNSAYSVTSGFCSTTFTRLIQSQEEAAQILHELAVLKRASNGLGTEVVDPLVHREKMFIDGSDNIAHLAPQT